MRAFWRRFKLTFRKHSADSELDDELQFHLDTQAEEYIRAGMSPQQARFEARRVFGGVEQVKEAYRDRRGFPWLDALLQDVRFGLRSLRRNPGFTAVAVLTMALGIGANTAVFSVVNAAIMRPLRFPDPDRLMVILSASRTVDRPFPSAPGVYLDWRDRATTFETIAGARRTQMILSYSGLTQEISIGAVSADFLAVLGTEPVRGRPFRAEEDAPGQDQVALITEEFQGRHHLESTDVLGKTLILNGAAHEIVGVLPSGFRFASFGAVDVWVPIAANRESRSGGDVVAIGRLRAGMTQEAAQSEMDVIMQQIRRERRQDSQTYVVVKPLHEWVVGDVRRSFLMLLGAVSFVLLICCANVANLLLARSTARQKEVTIRVALGAGRARLVAQTLIESVLLGLLGAALGAFLAIAAVRAIPSVRGLSIPRVDEIRVDLTILLAAVALAVLSGIAFGLAPALQIGQQRAASAMHSGDAPGAGWIGALRLRNGLVVVQLALALVLLTGAGLMAKTLLRLLTIDVGFERDRLLTITTRPPFHKYGMEGTTKFVLALAQEVKRLPWAGRVAAVDNLPLEAVHFPMELQVNGGRPVAAEARHIAGDYFSVTGIPLFAGRSFEPADGSRKPMPVVINQSLAAALFGGENPVGKRLRTDYSSRRELLVIGMVGDARQMGLTIEPGRQLYFPLAHGFARHILVRTSMEPQQVAPALSGIVRRLDADCPPPGITTMNEKFSQQVAKPRFYLMLLGIFAAAGISLAAIGAYGVMSYMIVRRTREFGIRMALGASPGDVLRLVMKTAVRLVLGGVILGLAGAAATVRVLSSLLFGVKPLDLLTFSITAALLAGVGLAACFLAARKATQADANVALRYE